MDLVYDANATKAVTPFGLNASRIMTKIAIFNQKGGVGKTTTALNLAGAMHAQGRKLAMLDLDPQAHLTSIHKHIGLDVQKHLFQFYQSEVPLSALLQPVRADLYLLAATAEMVKIDSNFGRGPTILKKLSQGLQQLSEQLPGLDVVIDCCPYIGVMSLNAIFASDLIIVPVSSDYFSVNSAVKVDKALRALEPVVKRRIQRRYLLTRADRRKKMTMEAETELRRLFAGEVLNTRISENIALAESPRVGKHVFDFAPSSPGARDYGDLAIEVQQVLQAADASPATVS